VVLRNGSVLLIVAKWYQVIRINTQKSRVGATRCPMIHESPAEVKFWSIGGGNIPRSKWFDSFKIQTPYMVISWCRIRKRSTVTFKIDFLS
jgi:hypothetical protein